MVTNPQIQEQIAKVRGWRECRISGGSVLWGYNPDNFWVEVPNWPTDREASYRDLIHGTGLLKNPKWRGFLIQTAKIYGLQEPHDRGSYPARFECLAYLLTEGYRWVDCGTCKGEVYVQSQPDGEPDGCPECFKHKRDGGEWEKEG